MPEHSRSRAGRSEAGRRRRPVGEVKKTWRKRDQQWRFALRIWWQGERVWVPLGLEADGWNDYRAKLELENVVREVAAGIWRPPAPPPPLDPNDRDPTFHEFATFWLEEKEADLERGTYDDYLNLLTNHLLPAFHDRRLSEIDYEAIRAYRTTRLREGARRRRAREAGVPLRDSRGRPLRPFGTRQVNSSIRLDRAMRSELFALCVPPGEGSRSEGQAREADLPALLGGRRAARRARRGTRDRPALKP
jgi:hypothetical protein